jgi:exodeoxyribonuclease VII small subunit
MNTTEQAPPESYREAMNDLEEIVNRLSNATDIDVDDLVDDVTRAKTLIIFCQEKINSAESKIKDLVRDIKNEDETDGYAGPSPTPDSLAASNDGLPSIPF